MTKARVLTTDEEIDAFLATADADDEPAPIAAVQVTFLPHLNAVEVCLNTSQRLLIPAEDLQDVSSAKPEQLQETEIIGYGSGIGFPAIDAHFSTEGLLAGRYGNRKWMEQLKAKRAAALQAAA